MTNLPDLPKGSALEAIRKAKTPADRAKAQSLAGNYDTNAFFREPVPAFFLELPHGDDAEAITDRIALAKLVSEDPYSVDTEGGSVGFRDLVGKNVTVWDLRAMAGGMGSGWKAYLILDITIGDSEVHELANTGAKQVVVTLARAWIDGLFPVTGRVVEIATRGSGDNKPLAFVVETPLG